MVVCVECLSADKPWDVVSATRRSSGVAPRACVRVYARVLVPPNLYIHTYIFYVWLCEYSALKEKETRGVYSSVGVGRALVPCARGALRPRTHYLG